MISAIRRWQNFITSKVCTIAHGARLHCGCILIWVSFSLIVYMQTKKKKCFVAVNHRVSCALICRFFFQIKFHRFNHLKRRKTKEKNPPYGKDAWHRQIQLNSQRVLRFHSEMNWWNQQILKTYHFSNHLFVQWMSKAVILYCFQ